MTIVLSPLLYGVTKAQMRGLFRYPGGKTWFAPYVKYWIPSLETNPSIIIEPFAGSAVISLNAVMDGLVEKAILVEKDPDVSAVWKTVLNGKGKWLSKRIMDFEISTQNVENELLRETNRIHETAFLTILKNRINRGGILAPGAGRIKFGENNKGLASRWYAKTLSDRIKNIVDVKRKISFIEGDGLKIMNRHKNNESAVFFIDPPYPLAGKRLYSHSEIDHEKIFKLANSLAGPFLMTYDDSEIIRSLAIKYDFDIVEIRMKNTHHNKRKELLISKNLLWFTSLFELKNLETTSLI